MPARRLGCISGAGVIAALITLLLTGGFVLVRGGSLFTPGPLNAQAGKEALGGVRTHADTGGRCEACHTAPWSADTLADRCLACHTSVAAELADPATLHGALKVERSASGCRTCHTEHRGPTASLTEINPATFPHAITGYDLTGHRTLSSGQPFTCADCHPASITRFDPATCDACHRQAGAAYMQAHTAAFGADCLACHDGGDRYGRRTFDHGRVFPLTGKHAQADCAACHAGARTPANLQAAPQTCVGCHAKDDKHQGAFGTACDACHTTSSWQGATFDHSKSAFPLTGKHVQVECAQCHVNNVYKGTPQTCVGCHQGDDKHQGAFGTTCSACHTTDSWQGATFDHSQSAFPLTGKHVQVECAACHVNNVYKGTPQTCVGCHAKDDKHQGAFGTECSACHTTDSWQGATFDHSRSAFPLTGKHVQVECAQCHVNNVYKGTPQTCVGCHQDPAYHLGVFGTTCADCHTADGWQPARFNRSHTFPLDHGESGISPCKTCHPAQVKAYTCYGCHEHTEAEIAAKHREEGIADFTDCMKCHPTGREDEGKGGGGD